jgi:hypothetical protein
MDWIREHNFLMAHVAELNENNEVTRVIVVHNDYEPNVEAWATEWAGGGIWKQTSYNANFRKNYAGIGYTYDEVRDAFIAPKPNDFTNEEGNSFTFILNEETCQWETLLLG